VTHRIRTLAVTAALSASVLIPSTAQALVYRDSDHRACVAREELRAMTWFNNVRRDVIEDRFEVEALPVDANDYVDPTNPHLYPVAYKLCGYNPETEQVLVINYRKTSDAWVWTFRLNR
jgi:hypothetical protein